MKKLNPFHLAVPVDNLEKARQFYGELLGCAEGRSSDHWIDFDFFGHQFVVHLSKMNRKTSHNPVDGHNVPIPHFGVVLDLEQWENLALKLKRAGLQFVIEPYIRFKDQPGEQATMFFHDPAGNALEFKAFKDIAMLFAR